MDVAAPTLVVGEGFAVGQSHHALTAMTSTAPAAVIAMLAMRRRRETAVPMLDTSRSLRLNRPRMHRPAVGVVGAGAS